jgi:uncharacterized membrane protein
MLNKKTSFIAAALSILFVTGCYYDKEELLYPGSGNINCSGVVPSYTADVRPLLQTKCNTSGCHNAASGAGSVVLETHTQVASKKARINQRCVIEKTMPPTGPLTPSELKTLKCWIDAGAPNN